MKNFKIEIESSRPGGPGQKAPVSFILQLYQSILLIAWTFQITIVYL